MTQEEYMETNRMQAREERFYVKFDHEIYKLQEKLKIKLGNIEPERASALKKIESQVKEVFSGKI